MALETVRNVIAQLIDLAKKSKAQVNPLQAQIIELTERLSIAASEKVAIQNQLSTALVNDAADAATIEAAKELATQAQQQVSLIQEELNAAKAEHRKYAAEHEEDEAALEEQLSTALTALSLSINN